MKNVKYLFLFAWSFLALSVQAQSIESGLWKAKSSFKLNGLPLPSSEGEECVTAEEAKDIKSSIVKELKKNGCELTQWNVKGKNLAASLRCQNKDLEASGELRGQFSKKSYQLQGEADGTYKSMIPSTATVALSGSWVKAACPK